MSMVETKRKIGLFEAYGVELEYMIVRANDLNVTPITDQLLEAVVGEIASDYENGPISWSNELALHVVELKTTDPAAAIEPLTAQFQENVRIVNERLRPLDARLMPAAMHPWMDPHAELKLWPHDNSPIYSTFNCIFDCTGHGWANLQSVHLNLPFADDAEFARLHAAIRLILPILPALAASSPVMDGRATGVLDNRLEVYRNNARRVPSVSGRVIPEAVFDKASYDEQIFQRMYRDIAPLDPEGILRHEWLNSRGAIARWDRHTIEIRVLDVQECPAADVAICGAIVAVLQAMVKEAFTPLAEQQQFSEAQLEPILLATIRDGDEAEITDANFLRQFGYPLDPRRSTACVPAQELWRHALELVGQYDGSLEDDAETPLNTLIEQGPLARRILEALDEDVSPERLKAVYGQLCDCLAEGRMFDPCRAV